MKLLLAFSVLLAASVPAETLYIQAWGDDQPIHEYDTDTGLEIGSLPHGMPGTWDMAVMPDGKPLVGGACVIPYDPANTTFPAPCWYGRLEQNIGEDVAYHANGELVVTDAPAAGSSPSVGFTTLRSDGSIVAAQAPPPGFGIVGLDVPRGGPYEDGVVALAVQTAAPSDYYLLRYKRLADGSLAQEGPFGPLPIDPWPVRSGQYHIRWHLTMRRSGMSLLLLEPLQHRVTEFDLDGNMLRTFATIPEDTAAAAPFGPILDTLSNAAVDANDRVAVLTQHRAYLFDSDGTLIRRFDDVLFRGRAVAFADWIPFESAGAMCRPWSVGFWKRQCASLGQSRRAMGPRSVRGGALPAPPIHPEFRDGRLPDVVSRANAWLEPFGLSACAALQPTAPNEWLDKTLRRYAAVALNVEDRRLGRRCTVTVDGSSVVVDDVLAEIRGLLAGGSEDELREAFHLCGALLGEEGD